MKQQSKSELEALLNNNASVEAIQDNARQIIFDNIDVHGLTQSQKQAIEAICNKVTIPLSMSIKMPNLPIVSSQEKKGIFSHSYNLAISVIIALSGILIYFEIIPSSLLFLIAILAIYLATSSFKLQQASEKERTQKEENAIEPTLSITTPLTEMESFINEQISGISRIITIIKELNKGGVKHPPIEDPLMGSHLEILKWMQRLYNDAARMERISTKRFREDISYILDIFDYDLIAYSPAESENFNVQHIKMENPEPNTVYPVIYHRNGEKKEVVLKGRVFLPKV